MFWVFRVTIWRCQATVMVCRGSNFSLLSLKTRRCMELNTQLHQLHSYWDGKVILKDYICCSCFVLTSWFRVCFKRHLGSDRHRGVLVLFLVFYRPSSLLAKPSDFGRCWSHLHRQHPLPSSHHLQSEPLPVQERWRNSKFLTQQSFSLQSVCNSRLGFVRWSWGEFRESSRHF